MQEQEVIEEVEFVDQSVWVPQGAEVIPAAAFLNGKAIASGKRFMSADAPLIDLLLARGRIEDSHHSLALRVVNLFRLATTKQGYATMQIFSPARGHDNSDFCPMTLFVRITRSLKAHQFYWIRVICGLEHCSYEKVSLNADLLRDALDTVEANLSNYEKNQNSVTSSDSVPTA